MKTTLIAAVTACLLIVQSPQAWGQFDFGDVLRGEIRRGAQQIEGEIRGAVRGAVEDWRHGGPPPQTLPYPPPAQTLPYPPPHQTLPYPPMPSPQPQPIIRPQPWQPGVSPPMPSPQHQTIASERYWKPGVPPKTTWPGPPIIRPEPSPPGIGVSPPMPSPQPQPIIRPQPWPPGVIRPVEPPICTTPLVTYPINNDQFQTQARPRTQSRDQSQTQASHQSQTQASQQSKPEPETEVQNLPTVFGGQEVAIDGEGFGEQAGSVRIKIGEMILIAETTAWSDTSVDAVIPELPLVEPTEALMAVISSEKQVVQQFAIRLAPADNSDQNDEQSASNPNPASEPQLPEVQMGTELELAGANLGNEPGSVQLTIGDSKLNASVVTWGDAEVTIRLPNLPLAESMPGSIQLILADGNPVSEIQVIFAK